MAPEPNCEQTRLSVLVGRWRTQGWTKDTTESAAARIDAEDTYEWLPGGFALLHRVDARVGEERVEGAEIIGCNPVRGEYITQYFGSDGQNAYHAAFIEEKGALVWSMRSRTDRRRWEHDQQPLGPAGRA
jgi:uncharacterized protein DUF1579